MKYVSVQRISEITGVKTKTLYEWAKRGKIPSRKVEKLVRFDEEEIILWMQCKVAAPAPPMEKQVDKILRSIYSQRQGRPSRLGKKVTP
ncbi:MAG: helix-turn-helix domain-containing protein [Nitrospirota bacterium]